MAYRQLRKMTYQSASQTDSRKAAPSARGSSDPMAPEGSPASWLTGKMIRQKAYKIENRTAGRSVSKQDGELTD
jgi:hypothetical protein